MYSPQIGLADIAHNLQLYASDYMPDYRESDALKSAVFEHDKLFQDITRRILNLENELRDLYAQRRDIVTSSVVKKALIAPIRKLAPETLGYVFQLACEDEVVAAADERRMITPHSMQLQLGLVCRRWRRVALGTPYLWTDIALERSSDLALKLNPFIVLTEWVRRSGGLPISVFIGDGLEKVFSNPKYDADLRACMDFLGDNFPRVRSFHVTNAFPQVLPALFPQGRSRDASALTDFRVIPSKSTLPLRQLLLGPIAAPNLEKIDVYRPSTFFDSIQLDYSRLRSLRWNTSTQRNDHESSLECLANVLTQCPNLHECEIVHPAHGLGAPMTDKEITVPGLKHLSLKFTLQSDPSPLLSILHTPNLESLTLEQTSPISNIAGFGGTVANFINNSSCSTLKDLHLNRLILSDEDAVLIPALSPVTSLNFKQCFIHDAFFDALNPQPNTHPDTWPVPKMATMSFEAAGFSADRLAEVVEHRVMKPDVQIEEEYKPRLVGVSIVRCRVREDDVRRLGGVEGVLVEVVDDA